MSPSPDSILGQFLDAYPETQYVDAYISDLSCVIRGKRYPVAEADKLFDSGMMLPGSTFLLSVNGDSDDPEDMGFSDGDPDEVGMPVAETLAPCPWAALPTAHLMLTLRGLDGTPYYFEPRNVLRRVLARFEPLGLRPVVAFEPEFYLLDAVEDPDTGPLPARSPLTGKRPDSTQVYSLDDIEEFGLYLDEVVSVCAGQDIRINAISKEYSPSQFELNLHHTDDPLDATDRYVMFRRSVQGIARKHGMRATFMAKPFPDNSGSGLHLHISLLDRNGNNVFSADGPYGQIDSISDTMRYSLGGLSETMADSMGIFAPNINSYRRFQPDIYVPVTADWGFENRSVAMRVPKSKAEARRIEHRVAGADANPYLLLATVLAGIHHGISRKIEPGAPATGNAGADMDASIPFGIIDAMDRTRHSEFLADYLGRQYVKVYTTCKLDEYREFQKRSIEEHHWYA
ncbi:MAG: glutamine synthetase [Gammaproteobacteria bacterium]|nr:glutamine synthetase [Gammaproteobacteria bacterium]MYJ51980.1 glutamine synthetase [Gammaproteobacteria bacterium]